MLERKIKDLNIDWHFVVVLLTAIIFFLIINYFNFLPFTSNDSATNRLIFNSPDETAYYWAAQNYYHQDTFLQFSNPSLLAGDLVSPRSLKIVNHNLVPTGFIGLSYLAASFAKIFHNDSLILLFSSLLTTTSLILLYLLLKKIYGPRVGLMSVILIMITPAYWYYASRPMVPNVPVCSLIFMAIYFGYLAIEKKSNLIMMLSGLFVGLAVLIRPSEFIWLGPLLLILLIFNKKKYCWSQILFALPTFCLALLPFFYFNIINFGSPLNIGYQIVSNSILSEQWFIGKYLLPFGFDLSTIIFNAQNYLKLIFSWQTTLFILALWPILLSLLNKQNKVYRKNLLILIIFMVVSVIVLVYYGSWKFSDNPNPRAITIGTSYVRYWLPIYILMSITIALGIRLLTKRVKVATYLFFISILLVWSAYSFPAVYLEKQEGIIAIKNNILNYQNIASSVLERVDQRAIIIAGRNDKIFFPARQTIFNLFYDVDYQRITPLLQEYPVYWWDYNYAEKDLAYLNSKYRRYQWYLEKTTIGYGQMSLYQIQNVKNK